MNYNFKKLDTLINFNFRDCLYILVRGYGHKYVSQCVYVLYYYQKNSVRETARLMDVSPQTILFWMRTWKFERRPRGGNVKSSFLRNPKSTKKIMRLKGKMSMRAAAEIIGCCPTTIRNTWLSKSKFC